MSQKPKIGDLVAVNNPASEYFERLGLVVEKAGIYIAIEWCNPNWSDRAPRKSSVLRRSGVRVIR